MITQQFRLPDVGEGLEEAEIVTWRVAVGDTVEHNQVLVEIETAKSLVELPSPFEGTVTELLAAEGQTVQVGSPIISIGVGASDTVDDPRAAEPSADTAIRPAIETAPATEDGHIGDPATTRTPEEDVEPAPSVLVGYGPTESRGTRRQRRRTPAELGNTRTATNRSATGASVVTRAKPPVRKLSKDLGISLAAVTASGARNTIIRDDVLRHAQNQSMVPSGQATPPEPETAAPATVPVPVPVPVPGG